LKATKPMLFEAERIDAEYRVEFSPPLFSLVPRVASLLEALHSSLSPRFRVPLTSLSALPGPSVGEVGARVSLFDGLVHIDVTPGYFFVSAEKMITKEDVAKVQDCIETSLRSVASFAETHKDATQPDKAKVVIKVWLAGPEGAPVVEMLNSLLSPAIADKFKERTVRPSPSFQLRSNEFDVDITLQQSALRENGVFASIELTVPRGSTFFGVAPTVGAVRAVLVDTMSLIGVELPDNN